MLFDLPPFTEPGVSVDSLGRSQNWQRQQSLFLLMAVSTCVAGDVSLMVLGIRYP